MVLFRHNNGVSYRTDPNCLLSNVVRNSTDFTFQGDHWRAFFKQCLRAQRDPLIPMAVVTVDNLIIFRGHVPNLPSHDANEKRPPEGDLLLVSGMEADLAIQQS